jgi:hypothetical protein
MKHSILYTALVIGALSTLPMMAGTRVAARGAVPNSKGGVNGGMAAAGTGAKGSYARGRAYQTDGTGNAKGGSAGGFKGANGSQGAYKSTWSKSANGTATYQGQAGASGARGSAQTSVNASRSASGQTTATTQTSATSKTTGNSYNGSTTYQKGQGATHTGTCTNASGSTIPCAK